jgi:hypothetical protein
MVRSRGLERFRGSAESRRRIEADFSAEVDGTIMSCRIDRVLNNDNLVVLFISGRITGEDVDMLWGVLARESGGFAIDLKNVLLVDREAVKLLALSEANGTELRNCPPYIREWVTRERAETHAHPSEHGLEEGRGANLIDDFPGEETGA